MAKTTFRIRGLDCVEEVAALKAELEPIPGVRELSFDVLNSRMSVDFSETQTGPEALAQAVARTGMRAIVWDEAQENADDEGGWWRWERSALTGVSGRPPRLPASGSGARVG